MKSIFSVYLPVLLLFVQLPAGSSPEVPARIMLKNVSVVDVQSGRLLTDQVVVVENGKITGLGTAAEVTLPTDALLIDGEGGFLLPGLADLHVHMSESDIPLFLANGITTIREMNGSKDHLRLRKSIEDDDVIGPRLFVASPLLSGVEQRWRHRLVTNADEAVEAAEEAGSEGYNALKVYDGLSTSAYDALVGASRRLGLPLVGHIPEQVGLERVLTAGQRSLEHVEQIAYATVGHEADPSRIGAIANTIAAHDVWVVPTLAAQRILTQMRTSLYNERFNAAEMRFVDQGTMAWWSSLKAAEGATPAPDDPRRRRAEAFYTFQRDLVAALHEAGVPLLVGTDTPNPMLVPGFSIHHELTALLDAGLTPLEVLRAATRDAARFMGEEGQWGTVQPEAAADLVLVKDNPLQDLTTLRSPVGVMVHGKWLNRTRLDEMLKGAEVSR